MSVRKHKLSDKQNLIISGILCCITPFLCYIMVECANSGWSCLFVDGAGLSIMMHILNLLIYVFFTGLVLLITASFRMASVTSYIFFLLIAAAQHYVCVFRGMGFVASDFFSIGAAKEVAAAYDFTPDLGMWIAIIIAIVGIIAASLFKGKITRNIKSRIVLAVGGTIVVAALFYGTYFCLPITRDMKVKLYKPQETYLTNGSMLAFVRSFNYLLIEKPEGYSAEKAQEIAKKYSEKTPQKERNTKETPNLILIMNESLCDVAEICNGKLETNKDVLPVIHGLKENTIKATLYEERRGGGTSIMEFEALTGCTNAFFPIGTMAYQTVIREKTPSLVTQLEQAGYGGLIASHPHSPKGYNREVAYSLLGFKEFISKDGFKERGHDQKYGKYISDRASYDEIIEEYEKYTKENDKPFFAFQVTMQNHAPYDSADTDDIKITSKDTYEESVEQYLNYAHTSDKTLGELINYFKDIDEPTLLVVFGDHAPMFDTEYYQKVLGITEDLTDEQEMSFQKTPMIIWANYGIKAREIGDMSDNYMSAEIVKQLGVGETGFQNFLRQLQKKVPVINSLGYKGDDGRYYQIEDKTSPYYNLINEYNILVYNLLIDRENTVKEFFE